LYVRAHPFFATRRDECPCRFILQPLQAPSPERPE
jgi:hypothetical protein